MDCDIRITTDWFIPSERAAVHAFAAGWLHTQVHVHPDDPARLSVQTATQDALQPAGDAAGDGDFDRGLAAVLTPGTTCAYSYEHISRGRLVHFAEVLVSSDGVVHTDAWDDLAASSARQAAFAGERARLEQLLGMQPA